MRIRITALAALAAMTIALTACGGGSGTTAATSTAGGKLTTLDVGLIPIADVAPLFLGMKKGFFADERIKIEPHFAQGGAAIVPGVIAGDFQIGFSNIGSLLVANTKGLPLRIIAQGDETAGSAAKAWTSLLAAKSGPIKTPKDLEGKTIAVNALHELNVVVNKAALAKQGVDVSKLKFTEVPFPDMPAALQSGRVDAISASEPFRTLGLDKGARVIAAPGQLQPNMTFAMYFATQSFIDDNEDLVARFVKAMNRSLRYAQSHTAEIRRIIPTYTKITPALAKRINLPVWTADFNVPSIKMIAGQALKYDLITQQPDLGELIWKGTNG